MSKNFSPRPLRGEDTADVKITNLLGLNAYILNLEELFANCLL